MPDPRPLIEAADLAFLRDLASDTLAASLVTPGQTIAGGYVNELGITIVRPGGLDCYPCFWTRDFVMSVDCGLVDDALPGPMLECLAHGQAEQAFRPTPGALVPAGAIPDHTTLRGLPVYYPGAHSREEETGRFGVLPPYDNQFYFIHLAWHLAGRRGAPDIVAGQPLLERLERAFAAVPTRPGRELAYGDPDRWAIGFGFADTVKHTGELLFASLLRRQAALELADLHAKRGDPARAADYRGVARRIAEELPDAFDRSGGLWRAATGESAQPDVWGSAYTLYSGAVEGGAADRLARALLAAYHAGTISARGGIRHVPTDGDYAPGQCWETSAIPVPFNTYQHGAYWHTPTGWVARALARVDADAARGLVRDYIAALRADDFRLGEPGREAPYECFHPAGDYRQNPVYLTSVTCPLAALAP